MDSPLFYASQQKMVIEPWALTAVAACHKAL